MTPENIKFKEGEKTRLKLNLDIDKVIDYMNGSYHYYGDHDIKGIISMDFDKTKFILESNLHIQYVEKIVSWKPNLLNREGQQPHEDNFINKVKFDLLNYLKKFKIDGSFLKNRVGELPYLSYMVGDDYYESKKELKEFKRAIQGYYQVLSSLSDDKGAEEMTFKIPTLETFSIQETDKLKEKMLKESNKLNGEKKFLEKKPKKFRLEINLDAKEIKKYSQIFWENPINTITNSNGVSVNINNKEFYIVGELTLNTSDLFNISWSLELPKEAEKKLRNEDIINRLNFHLSKSFDNLDIDLNLLVKMDESKPTLVSMIDYEDKDFKGKIKEFEQAIQVYYEVFSNIIGEKGNKKMEYKIPVLAGLDMAHEDGEKNELEKFKVKSKTTFKDIGGYIELKNKLQRVMEMKKYSRNLSKFGIKSANGMLLYGPPGTGKSHAAQALAGELKADFYSIKSSDIFEKWVGSSGRNMDKILKDLPKNGILFIDEIDSLMSNRDTSHETSIEVLNLLLQYMSSTEAAEKNTMIIGATNRKNAIDPAALRSGRFSTQIEVGMPDTEAIIQIFKVHINKINKEGVKNKAGIIFSKYLNLDKIAKVSEGLSGADIAEIIRKISEDRVIKRQLSQSVKTNMLIEAINIFKKNRSNDKKIGFDI